MGNSVYKTSQQPNEVSVPIQLDLELLTSDVQLWERLQWEILNTSTQGVILSRLPIWSPNSVEFKLGTASADLYVWSRLITTLNRKQPSQDSRLFLKEFNTLINAIFHIHEKLRQKDLSTPLEIDPLTEQQLNLIKVAYSPQMSPQRQVLDFCLSALASNFYRSAQYYQEQLRSY